MLGTFDFVCYSWLSWLREKSLKNLVTACKCSSCAMSILTFYFIMVSIWLIFLKSMFGADCVSMSMLARDDFLGIFSGSS